MTTITKACSLASFLLFAASFGSCSTANYDFDGLSELHGSPRAERLTSDLLQERQGGEHQDLYDVKMIPLVHTRLNVFTEESDEDSPGGYVEADIEAYLPLFGIVNAAVTRYDDERNMSEHHEFDSYLWGMFQSHREKVDTRLGLRETKGRRFLWFFGWRSPSEYTPSTHDVWHSKAQSSREREL